MTFTSRALLAAAVVACAVAARAQDDPVSQALRAADDLAEQGRFREAIAALERDAPRLAALDPEGWAEHGPGTLAFYRTFVPAEVRFEAAIAEAGRKNTAPLEAWVREVEGGVYEHVGYAFVERWRARARAALGDAAYQKIVSDLEGEALQAMPFDDVLRGDPEAEVEGPKVVPPAVEPRGSAERRARMREEAAAQGDVLARARAEVAAVERARAAREAAASARARGAPLGEHTLLGWDERGFTVERAGGGQVTTPWDEADPLAAVRVRACGVAPDDAQGLHDLGLFALERGVFDQAERALAQAAAIDSRWARPDLDVARLRRRTAELRAEPLPGSPSDPLGGAHEWTFDDPDQALDFAAAPADAEVEVVSGELRVRCPSSAALARLRGAWREDVAAARPRTAAWTDELRVELTPAAPDPPALVAFSGPAARAFVEVGATRARLLVVGADREVEVARAERPAGAAWSAAARLLVHPARLRVTVTIGGREALAHELPWTGPVEVMVGASGPEARLDRVRLRTGLRRVEPPGPDEVVRALVEADAARGRDGLPAGYRTTSAEDAVGLEGVGADARALLDEGRVLVRQGELPRALASFDAARDRAPTCAAALYLSGRARLDTGDVEGALERARAASALVEDFHEAWTLEAAALLRRVRLDEAGALLDRAAAIAPASPLVWRARAELLLWRGDRDGAREAAALAAALAPDDRELAAAAARLARVAAEPAVSRRLVSGSLSLFADPSARARGGLEALAAEVQGLLARLPAVLPTLAARAADRPRRVILLGGDAFGRHLALRGAPADRDLGWFVDAAAGDVLARDVVGARRGVVRLWLEEQGALGLPPWVRDGVVLALGDDDAGALFDRDLLPLTDEAPDALATLAVGWPRRPSFFDLATGVRRPPELTLPALDEALGWALVAYCLTPGARAERFEGGQVALADLLAGYLGRLARPSGEKARLEHAWVETFHALDRRSLEGGLETALRYLADRHHLPWADAR